MANHKSAKKRAIQNKIKNSINAQYLSKVRIDWLINSYNISNDKENFFGNSFHEIAGNFTLEKQIKSGLSKVEIKKSWEAGLNNFKKIREKYLIYP